MTNPILQVKKNKVLRIWIQTQIYLTPKLTFTFYLFIHEINLQDLFHLKNSVIPLLAPKPRGTVYFHEIYQTQGEKRNQIDKWRKYLLIGVQVMLTSQSLRGDFRAVVIKLCSTEPGEGIIHVVYPGLFYVEWMCRQQQRALSRDCYVNQVSYFST